MKGYCESGLPRAVKGDLNAIHEYPADDYMQHTEAHRKAGKGKIDDHKDSVAEAVKAIPDLQFQVSRLGDASFERCSGCCPARGSC